jgi:hypothetical protein
MKPAHMKSANMKRAIIVGATLLRSLSPALASSHYAMQWHDMGHKVSDAVFNASLNACYSQTGMPRNAAATPAFKDCMRAHNEQWVSTRLVQDPPSKQTADDGFIDPDTGMVCHNAGIGAICVPPNGTVRYTNDEGLNCTRTGLVAFCSSF